MDVLSRFASLRAANMDDQAMAFLDPDCEWRRLDLPEIFKPPPELSEAVIKGPERIKQLWDEQARQGFKRIAQTDWKDDASGMDNLNPSKGGRAFSRQAKILGKDVP